MLRDLLIFVPIIIGSYIIAIAVELLHCWLDQRAER